MPDSSELEYKTIVVYMNVKGFSSHGRYLSTPKRLEITLEVYYREGSLRYAEALLALKGNSITVLLYRLRLLIWA